MGKAIAEYEVEESFMNRLGEMGYKMVTLKNYDDVKENFRKQLCKVNETKVMEAGKKH